MSVTLIVPAALRDLSGGRARLELGPEVETAAADTAGLSVTDSSSTCTEGSMRRRKGAGCTPIQIMSTTIGTRMTNSRRERSGIPRFSSRSIRLKNIRCTMGSM